MRATTRLSSSSPTAARSRCPFSYVEDGDLTHGYATTVHKGQGVTCDSVLVLGDDSFTNETAYTALTRGRLAQRALPRRSRTIPSATAPPRDRTRSPPSPTPSRGAARRPPRSTRLPSSHPCSTSISEEFLCPPIPTQQQHTAPGESIVIVLFVAVRVPASASCGPRRSSRCGSSTATSFTRRAAAVAQRDDPLPAAPLRSGSGVARAVQRELPDAAQYWLAIWLGAGRSGSCSSSAASSLSDRRIRTCGSGRGDRGRVLTGAPAPASSRKDGSRRPANYDRCSRNLPLHGRFLLGKVGWHYLATEPVWTALPARSTPNDGTGRGRDRRSIAQRQDRDGERRRSTSGTARRSCCR